MTGSQPLRTLTGALALAACAPVTPACAADATTDVDISRVTLKLPGGGWTVSAPLPYGVAVDSSPLTVGGQQRLFTMGTPGSRDSLVMLVSATRGSPNVTLHADCEPEDHAYVRRFNRGQSPFVPLQCLRVQGPARMPADPKVFGEAFADALDAQHAAMPTGGYAVMIDVCNENGAIVEITALIGDHFEGLQASSAAARVPSTMPVGVAAWADKLAEEALGTLSSWSGRMPVPPVVFAPPEPLPAATKTALAAPAATED